LRTQEINRGLCSGELGAVTLLSLTRLYPYATGDPCRGDNSLSQEKQPLSPLFLKRQNIMQQLSKRNLEKSKRVTFCSAEDFLYKPAQRDRKGRFAEVFMGEIQLAYSQAHSAFDTA